jgi:septum formation protein
MKGSVVLASASPRRRDLLEAAGYSVTCAASAVEELEVDHLDPGALALENARRKSTAIRPGFPDRLVIAADTVVAMQGEFFGKPGDEAQALRMLRRLRGQSHVVVTGVVVSAAGRWVEFYEQTVVTFRDLDDEALIDYIRDIHPYDKAGGYAAQDDHGRIIQRIEGSMTNVIGLPMERLEEVLSSLLASR